MWPDSLLDFNAADDSRDRECDTMKIPLDVTGSHLDDPDTPKALRVLIAGRSAAGKSTLVSSVFGWTPRKAGVSHGDQRTPLDNVFRSLQDPSDPRIILHDSGGFEAGGVSAVDKLIEFIEFRRKQTDKDEVLHCIWYCISCSEKRLTHEVEDTFFRTVDVGDIPIIVVFTQFDYLVEKQKKKLRKLNFDPRHLDETARHYAVTDYDENYRRKIEHKFNLKSTVSFVRVGIPDADDADDDTPLSVLPAYGIGDLLDVTASKLDNGGLKSLLAYGQRHSADQKLRESPEYGMNMFSRVQWTNSIPIVPFIGATGIYSAFCKILFKISRFWRIPGTLALIGEAKVRNHFFAAVFEVKTWYGRLGVHFLNSINITGPITADMTAALLLKMIASITLVHERLFWIHLANKGLPVTEADVRMAVEQFEKDGGKGRMADRIDANAALRGYRKNKCIELLKDAIEWGKSPKYAEYLAR